MDSNTQAEMDPGGVRQQRIAGIPISYQERDRERTGRSGSDIPDCIGVQPTGTLANLHLIVVIWEQEGRGKE